MSTDSAFNDPQEYVQESLGEHREVLEKLAELDTGLSDDAKRALSLLDEEGDQS
jgi:hypothetical protein